MKRFVQFLALTALLAVWGCGSRTEIVELPQPDLSAMEPQVVAAIDAAAARTRDDLSSAEAWGALGAIYDVHGLYDAAEVCYRHAHELEGGEFRWAYLLAIVRDVNGADHTEIRRLFQTAQALRPDYAPVQFRTGHALSLRGELVDAEVALRRATELDPTLALAHRELGQVLMAVGRLDEAATSLNEAGRLEPRDAAVYSTLAQIYRSRGEEEMALRLATRAQSLTPLNQLVDSVHADFVTARGASALHWIERAKRYLARQEFESAIDALEVVRGIRPDDADIHYQLGSVHLRNGDDNAAYRELSRAVELNPGNRWARLELATLFERTGRLEEAEAELRRVQDDSPGLPDSLTALTQVLAKMGDDAAAIGVFEQLARITTLDARMETNWGNALLRSGQTDAAIDRFVAGLKLRPDYLNAHLNLGIALERKGETTQALAHYEAALRIDPQHPAAARNAERLR